jgi:type VII secretion protein EccE
MSTVPPMSGNGRRPRDRIGRRPGRAAAPWRATGPLQLMRPVVRAQAAACLAMLLLVAGHVRPAPVFGGCVVGAALLVGAQRHGRTVPARAGALLGLAARRLRRPEHGVLADLTVVGTADRDGRPICVVAGQGGLAAVLAVEPAGGAPVFLSRRSVLPLSELIQLLARPELGLHSLQVVTEAWPVHRRTGHGAPSAGRRRTYVMVRLEPAEAADPIRARGGGWQGARRILGVAIQRLELVLAEAGLAAQVLDRVELLAVCRRLTGPLVDSRRARTVHDGWRTGATEPDVVTTGVTLRPGEDDTVDVTVAIRVSAGRRPDVLAAGAELRELAAAAGVRLASLPCGGGTFSVPINDLGRLAIAPTGVGVHLGRTDDGALLGLDLAGRLPMTISLIGPVEIALRLARRALDLGVTVVVCTDRAARWASLRSAGAAGYRLAITDLRQPQPSSSDVDPPTLVVDDLRQSTATPARSHQTVLYVRAAEDIDLAGLVRSSEVVLVATLPPAQAATVANLLRLDGSAAAQLHRTEPALLHVVSATGLRTVRIDAADVR